MTDNLGRTQGAPNEASCGATDDFRKKIEVGSLWVAKDPDKRKNVAYVKFVDEHHVVASEYECPKKLYWACTRHGFIDEMKPYTLPKEYKVWVYETFDGKTYAYPYQETNYANIGLTLKAILTGKEGDGL
jgi:hypothetical protein